jgi:hypothetical protein
VIAQPATERRPIVTNSTDNTQKDELILYQAED